MQYKEKVVLIQKPAVEQAFGFIDVMIDAPYGGRFYIPVKWWFFFGQGALMTGKFPIQPA